MQWCRQIDAYFSVGFRDIPVSRSNVLEQARLFRRLLFQNSQHELRNCLKAWTMTLKLQIFLLFLIKTLRYVWLVFCFLFLTIPRSLAFSKIIRQLSSIKVAFFGGVDGSVRFSHESFCQRLTSAALYPWYKFIFLCFHVINIYSHTQKQREMQFKPRMKLNQNCYILRFLSHTTKKCDALLIRRNSYGTDLKRTRSGFRRWRTGRWRNDHKTFVEFYQLP